MIRIKEILPDRIMEYVAGAMTGGLNKCSIYVRNSNGRPKASWVVLLMWSAYTRAMGRTGDRSFIELARR